MRFAPFILAVVLASAPATLPPSSFSALFTSAYADDDDDGGGRRGGDGRGSRSENRNGGGDWVDRGRPAARGGSFFPRLFGAPRQQRQRVRPQPAPPAAMPDEIVVADVTGAEIDRLVGAGFTLVARAPLSVLQGEIARLTPPPDVDLDTARERILAIAPAAAVDLNHLYRPVEMPCRQDDCPAFAMIDWPVPPATCSLPATLGMIDTVVNVEHEALRDQAIEVVSVISSEEAESGAVHGTAIAALLVGSSASRTPGLLPQANLVAVEAFHRDPAGDAADAYKIVRAIDELAVRSVQVVNMSFAGPANAVLERTADNAQEAGMILIAAAGNNGPKAPPAYPAAYAGIVAVTAVDKRQRIYRQASRGDHIDFAAPGVRLWTAASVSGGRFRSGTSYAVPFVSAAVASLLAQDSEQGVDEVLQLLSTRSVDLGDSGRDSIFGWGLVKAGTGCS